jgi:phosphoribosylformylglycinamidine cyclo-ligase
LDIADRVAEFDATVGDVLLTPTRIYAKVVRELTTDARLAGKLTGIAHITGGGLVDNIGRIVPDGFTAVIQRKSYDVPAVFSWVQKLGAIDREEMYRVFNMGFGLVVIVRPAAVDDTRAVIAEMELKCHVIGAIERGNESAVYAD